MEKDKEIYYYYSVNLTLGPDKKDVKNKTYDYLQGRILEWGNRIKNIGEVLIHGPFLDEGENKNIHINMTLKSNINNIEDIRKKYFMGWIRSKGYVNIGHTRNLEKWNEYAERNHYKLLVNNIMNK
jgi:hypothetical protein